MDVMDGTSNGAFSIVVSIMTYIVKCFRAFPGWFNNKFGSNMWDIFVPCTHKLLTYERTFGVSSDTRQTPRMLVLVILDRHPGC